MAGQARERTRERELAYESDADDRAARAALEGTAALRAAPLRHRVVNARAAVGGATGQAGASLDAAAVSEQSAGVGGAMCV